MSKFRDFGSTNLDELEPISFKIHDEEFHCIRAMQGKVLLDMIAKSSSEDPAEQAGIVTSFFAQVLDDESLERFNALVTDKHRIVTTETLAEITSWLIEQYSDRPNQQPEA
jgi:coenzyme F420-reducing hydrogenase beta subunit